MYKKGFTIIELLVVITIIGVLSSLAMAQLSYAQRKSRDARRMSDVGQITKALNLYQIDNNIFPIHTSAITITGDDAFSSALEASGAISEVPADPHHPGSTYIYQSNSSGSDYDITFCLETDSIPNYSQGCSNTIGP